MSSDDHDDQGTEATEISEYEGDAFGAGGFNTGLGHDEHDEMALFHVIYGSTFMILGLAIIVRMYQSRKVLEIRCRSAYLVTVIGVCLLADFAIDVHVECVHLFGWPSSLFATHLAYFFLTFTIAGCYICRVIRLGVAFSRRIKEAIPWIMSEKLLVAVSVIVGLLSMSIPGHYYQTGGGDTTIDFVLAEQDMAWKSQVGLLGVQLALLPVVWMVDDAYRISWELAIIVMLGLLDVVSLKMANTRFLTDEVKEYINSSNIRLLWSSLLFSLSIVDPLRRLTFNPMARELSSRTMHAKRKNSRIRDLKVLAPSDSSEESFFADVAAASAATSAPSSVRSNGSTKWSYAKMAAVPAIAEAFRVFAWRALCQESIMFLEEVTTYESGNYEISSPVLTQLAAFNHITKRFIDNGAVDEINISSRDKERLLSIYHAEPSTLSRLDEEERKVVFREVYVEIRSMLEVNLLHRFLHTEGFRKVQVDTPPTGAAKHGFGAADNV